VIGTRLVALMMLVACIGARADEAARCPPADGVAVQVLGSGGPIADDDRASSAYLVWIDGRARVMIDTGTGSVLRFAESGARFDDLDFVGLSHFHTDHSADFPALLKSGNFSRRSRPLHIAGPSGNRRFPGLAGFLDGMFDPGDGVYRYLSGYLDGSGGLVLIEPRMVGRDARHPVTVFESESLALRIDALPVPHGIVPALAFRVSFHSRAVVFGSDQTLSDPAYAEFARGADLLVAHMAIPEDTTGAATQLHAKPSAIGATADAADVDTLLLSHFMARSLENIERNVNAVRTGFDGRVLLGSDLVCLPIG